MTIQTRKSQNTKIGKVESDAYLPTESGNFRVSVTPDENGMEHALLYVDGFEESENPLRFFKTINIQQSVFHTIFIRSN